MKGSCHCGTLAYEVDAIEGPASHCHCITCRKTHAAAFVTTARVARDKFRWLQGADRVAAYESSPGKKRHFCPVCGCHLVAAREGQPHVILRMATLDADPGIRPAFHIWRSHGVAWLEEDGDLPSYAEWPAPRG
ncbi:MAG: GFA family protein [Betaproteobacteria bacterium]